MKGTRDVQQKRYRVIISHSILFAEKLENEGGLFICEKRKVDTWGKNGEQKTQNCNEEMDPDMSDSQCDSCPD